MGKSIFTAEEQKLWRKYLATVYQCNKKGCKKPPYYDIVTDWERKYADLQSEKMNILRKFS